MAIPYNILLFLACSLDLWTPCLILSFQDRKKDKERKYETTQSFCHCPSTLSLHRFTYGEHYENIRQEKHHKTAVASSASPGS